jgi:hypothetical protein
MSNLRICTPVYGPDFEMMFVLFSPVVKRFVPDAEIIAHRYSPPGHIRYPAQAGDWAKAQATFLYTADGPIFVVDVDAVIHAQPMWEPSTSEVMLSMPVDVGFSLNDVSSNAGLICQQNILKRAGFLKGDETVSVNPQFFWASGNVFSLYEEMLALYNTLDKGGDKQAEAMASLTVWTMVWIRLREAGKAEKLPEPHPVWHSPMIAPNRLHDFGILTAWMMSQPVGNPVFPPASLFGVPCQAGGWHGPTKVPVAVPVLRKRKEARSPDVPVQRYYKPDGQPYREVKESK